MKFLVRFKTININIAAWQKKMDAKLSKEIERAATVWLNATVLLVIPVWSGASRATFLKLARSVGFPLTITGLQAPSGLIERYPNRWGPRVGFQQSKGSVSKNPDTGNYTFTYQTSLFHLIFNEFHDANANPAAGKLFARLHQPGPYGFQEIGRAAFEDYARTAVELPSPWRSLKFSHLRVG